MVMLIMCMYIIIVVWMNMYLVMGKFLLVGFCSGF